MAMRPIVNTGNLWREWWDSEAFIGLDATLVIDELGAQNLLYCDESICEFYHPLLVGLLNQYLIVL